jgi:hypothetical protein
VSIFIESVNKGLEMIVNCKPVRCVEHLLDLGILNEVIVERARFIEKLELTFL